MSQSSLIVERVIADESCRIALQVVPPGDVDLQFIYRAAKWVYWDPSRARLEDRYDSKFGDMNNTHEARSRAFSLSWLEPSSLMRPS